MTKISMKLNSVWSQMSILFVYMQVRIKFTGLFFHKGIVE